jgi:hypothetical protein
LFSALKEKNIAKPIVLTYKGEESSFDHTKIDRSKLYGKKRRIPLDQDGNECQRASLMDDGSLILTSGMTAQGYFTKNEKWIPNKDLVGLSLDKKPLDLKPSTLGVATEMELQDDLEDLADLSVQSIYSLEPIEIADKTKSLLDSGNIFRFAFNYRADYNEETGYLLKNSEGHFALIGTPSLSEWTELKQIATDDFYENLTEDEDIDFEMF